MLLAVMPTSSQPSLPASSSASRSLAFAGTLLRSILLYSHWGILGLLSTAIGLDRLGGGTLVSFPQSPSARSNRPRPPTCRDGCARTKPSDRRDGGALRTEGKGDRRSDGRWEPEGSRARALNTRAGKRNFQI